MRLRIMRTVIVASTLAVVLVLTGCVSAPVVPATGASTPTNEKVSAELAPFYSQVLQWKRCEGDVFQCATAKAPLDWANPAAETIDLALIRKPASGKRLGSLLVNPGGPGGSGFDFVKNSVDYAADATLQQHYDIVGFDPRGVNKSSAVKCYQNPAELDTFLYGITSEPYGSDAWIDFQKSKSAAFAAACAEYSGALLGFVDTNSAARDLDLLRAALGDTRLNYLGYSYGTLLGATYAGLYPKKTGRLVLDGALDPATTNFDVSATQAQGFERAMRAYIADCETASTCPFTSGVDAAMSRIKALLASLDASPLRAVDGRQLGSAAMFTAIIYPLYNQANWPALTKLFVATERGDPSEAFTLADAYYGRNADGTYADNSTEAFIAINCLDYADLATTNEQLKADAAKLLTLAPTFGTQLGYDTTCLSWPFASTRERVEITAAGSAPILVVGTTDDPATPYIWAEALAKQLQNGHLVTYKGEGHTAYNKSNACVNGAVDDFFVNGTVPREDPKC